MVKYSYEDTFPWTTPDKWGVTISTEAIRWAGRTWQEGQEESKQDLANLIDFNETLKRVYKKLRTDNTDGTAAGGAAVSTPPTPGSTQNRVPRKNYDTLWATCDAITTKCRIWIGTSSGERGKLGALCGRYLYVCGYQSTTVQIPEYENLEETEKEAIDAATTSGTQTLAERQAFCKKHTEIAHCNALKPHLFAAFPSLHPFFYFAPFCLQKDESEFINGEELSLIHI